MGEIRKNSRDEGQTPLSYHEENRKGRLQGSSVQRLQNETQQSLEESVQFNTYKNVLENATLQPGNDTIQNSEEDERVYREETTAQRKPIPQIAIENYTDTVRSDPHVDVVPGEMSP